MLFKERRNKALVGCLRQCARAVRSRGFTIVELAVVIIVIAILATVTIVSYSKVQKSAATAQYTSAADAIMKRIQANLVRKPLTSAEAAAIESCCAAKIADLPARGVFAAGECMKDNHDFSVMANDASYDRIFGDDVTFRTPDLPEQNMSFDGAIEYGRSIQITVSFRNRVSMTWVSPDRSSCASVRGGIFGAIYETIKMYFNGEITLEESGLNESLTDEELHVIMDSLEGTGEICFVTFNV